MTKNSFIIVLVLMFLSCADKESEEILVLKGEVKGQVRQVTEFGQLETVQSGATLFLRAGNTEISAVTDQEGNYTLKDVPTGTYNVIIEKAGFSSTVSHGLRVMGGKEPLYTFYYLTRPSTSKITGLTMDNSGSSITIKGLPVYSAPSSSSFIRIVIFFSNSPDVGASKHLTSQQFSYSQFFGSPSFTVSITPNLKIFPSGSTIYAVAYGLATATGIYMNPETGLAEYTGLGTIPSNVASVKIP